MLQVLQNTPTTVAAIVELERAASAAPWTSGVVASELLSDHRVYVGAYQPCADGTNCHRPHIDDALPDVAGNTDLVAFAGIAALAGVAHVMEIAVHPSRQRKGLGRALLARLIDEAGECRCEIITLEVREQDDRARRFYAAAGFVECGLRRNYYPGGQSAVVASRPILSRAGARKPEE